MGWPDDGTGLPIEVWAAFGAEPEGDPGGWTWTNLSTRLQPTPIPWRRGASDGAGEVSASSATVLLGNDDGALTPLQAMSEYWPNVEMGTPIWLPLRRAGDSFARTVSNGWGAADSGQSWTAWNGSASDYSTNGTAGRHNHGTINFLRRTALDVNLLDVHQTVDVSTSALTTGAALVTGLIARYDPTANDYYWCRTEFNSGGTTVTLKITRVRDGVLTDLGVLNPVSGLAYAANTPLRIRVSVIGGKISMKVWTASGDEPSGWHLEATDPDPLTAPGQTGVQSWVVSGNTNSPTLVASFANYVARVDILNGFADSWVPVFIPTSDGRVTSNVRVTASGILRRLGQGQNPLHSALRRRILTLAGFDAVVGYWSLEGGRDQRQAPSTLPGGQPLQAIGTVEPHFGEVDGPGGSDTLPDLTSHGVLVGPVPTYTHTDEWQIEVWFRTETGDSLDFTASVPLQWDTPSGSVIAWDVLLFVGQGTFNPGLGNIGFDISGYTPNPDGGEPGESQRLDIEDSIIIEDTPSVQGSWRQLQVCAQQSAPTTIELSAYLDGRLLGLQAISGHTLGPVTRVTVNPLQGAGAYAGVDGIGLSSVGHVVIYNTINDPLTYQAGLGYPGETATERIARLCTEEGIPTTVPDVESEPMGPQGIDTLLELLRQCERADFGILHERGWGLGYRPRDGRYLQAPKLVVDLGTYRRSGDTSQDQVVAPVYDDQGIRNVWTASRRNGLSATFSDAAHVDRHGTRDDSVELDVATDDVLIHHAAWRVHLGTWREMRYPGISVDLAANRALIDDWLNLTIGDRAQQISPPAPHPPEDVDQLVGGQSATLSPSAWSGQITGTPARPWDVAIADGDDRVPADGSTLAAGLTDVATSLLLASTVANGPWWVGNTSSQPDDFPLSMRVGGEIVTVSEIGPSITDAFGRTAASTWGSPDVGPAYTTSGGAASDYSVSSGTGRHSNTDVNNQRRIKLDVGHTDWDYTIDFLLPMTNANTSPVTVWFAGRLTDDSNHYLAVASLSTAGVMSLRLDKRVGGSLTNVTAARSVASNTSGDRWRVRFRGSGSTLWATAQNITTGTAPVSIGGTDTSLTAGTQIGILTRLETGNTNSLPVVIQFDNLTVNSPQTVTLSARGVNGIERAWAAGTPIDVAETAVAAL